MVMFYLCACEECDTLVNLFDDPPYCSFCLRHEHDKAVGGMVRGEDHEIGCTETCCVPY